MNKNFVELESYQDRLGQEVKLGDVVIYPRMLWSAPKVTFGKIVNVRQRKGWEDRPYITVRIEAVDHISWGFDREKYPDAQSIITTFKTTLRNYKNLIKVDANMLIGVFKDVLIDGKTVLIYYRKIDQYTRYWYTIDENGIECEFKSPFEN